MYDLMDLNNTLHLERYKAILASYTECHRCVHPTIDICFDNILEVAKAIDPIQDSEYFVGEHETGYLKPAPIQFEKYVSNAGCEARSNTKRKDSLDYSNPPPGQKRKKLLEKIEQVDFCYQEELLERIAREKMIHTYSKNPKLGNTKLVKDSLLGHIKHACLTPKKA